MNSDASAKMLKSQGKFVTAPLIENQLCAALVRVLDEAIPLAAARLSDRIRGLDRRGGASAPADHLPVAPTPYAILVRPEVRV